MTGELQFPRCEFEFATAAQVAALLERKLAERGPASLVRLGDGEGMVLARPASGGVLWPGVCAHFGPHVTDSGVARLGELLAAAIAGADVIGVRDDLRDVAFDAADLGLGQDEFMARFKASFRLRPVERDIVYPAALRLALLHRHLATRTFRPETTFMSAWLHFRLSSSGALVAMMRRRGRVGLICSKAALAGRLEELLGLEVDFYEVPEIYALAEPGSEVHFPNRFERLMDELRVAERGQLFLIGAGICGKVYCQRVKDLGGVAVDVGAVCDAWLGLPSRPLVFKSLYGGDGDVVPEDLLLETQAARRRAAGGRR